MIRRPVALVVGAAAALALAAPAAVAASTYTVVAGTTTTGTTTISAKSVGAIVVKDVTKGLGVNCASGTGGGSVKLGRGIPGKGLATISNVTASTCTVGGGSPFSITQSGTWTFDATSPTVGGVTNGVIRGVQTAPGSGLCSFTVAGTIKARLTTTATSQRLELLPKATMTVSNVTFGCLGQVSNGDKASIGATFDFTAGAGRLIISSP